MKKKKWNQVDYKRLLKASQAPYVLFIMSIKPGNLLALKESHKRSETGAFF